MCVGNLVPVLAVSVALAEPVRPAEVGGTVPDHLEDIVMESHPSLGGAGRMLLRNLLHGYAHVFPAPGEPVTGHTTSVQHEILTSDARPVRCGTRRLAPAGLQTEQTCVKEMFEGGQGVNQNSRYHPLGLRHQQGDIESISIQVGKQLQGRRNAVPAIRAHKGRKHLPILFPPS